MVKGKFFTRLQRQILSRSIIQHFFLDISLFGSIPFYWAFAFGLYFAGMDRWFFQLAYCFLLSMVIVIVIKSIHYKDRPIKEEFSIFMEKMIASSFPSTHSLNITILAILASIWINNIGIVFLSSTLAVCVYIQRYLSRKHFVIDIIGGILIGIAEVTFVLRVF